MQNRFNFLTRLTETVDVYNLAHCDKASFHGKAKIIETAGAFYLLSYQTIVCKVDKATRDFVRFWDGESATTTRHINAFLQDMKINGGGLSWWRKQDIKPEDAFVQDVMYAKRYV